MVITAYNPRMRTTISDEAMITIFAVNDPPFINEIDVIVGEEDSAVSLWSMESLYEDGIIGDIDDSAHDFQYHLYMDSNMINIDWDDNFNSYPVLIPELNFNGSSILVICVSDGEYEECRDVEVVFNSINDLPFFTSEMESPIGRDLDFHLELNFEDIDDPYEDLSLSIVNSPDWVILDGNFLHGNASVDLGYYEVVLELQDLSDVLIDTFGLHVENFIPEITQIVDIPDDQGGRVYLTFNASFFDDGETNGQSYGLFRYDDMGDGFFDWTQLTSVDAIGEPQYTFEATTLVDSTFDSDGITTFKILASTVGGLFYSEEFSGYSIDNISPAAPSGLVANAITDGIMLNWNANDDEDFSHYVLE